MTAAGRGPRRATPRASIALLAAAVAFLGSGAARAADTDVAAAETLFDEAKALMTAGNYAEACPKLQKSLELDFGGGTQLHLALCREGEGKTATAWLLFHESLATAHRDGRADRERVARDHLEELAKKITKLAIDVPEHARAEGLRVTRDGEAVPANAWGLALPVDPGEHVIEATAPGRSPGRYTVGAREPGAVTRFALPELRSLGDPDVAGPLVLRGGDHTPPDRRSLGTQRTIAIVAAGVGVVGVAVGAVFGLRSMGKKSDADGHCHVTAAGRSVCDAQGVSLGDEAIAAGNVSTIAFAVGALGLVASGILWTTAPKSSAQKVSVIPYVGPEAGGLAARGAF